jgi:uncharacterized protein YodC (DUF2158 family)
MFSAPRVRGEKGPHADSAAKTMYDNNCPWFEGYLNKIEGFNTSKGFVLRDF